MTAPLPNDRPIAIAPGFRLQWEEAQGAHVLLFPEGMVRLSESAGGDSEPLRRRAHPRRRPGFAEGGVSRGRSRGRRRRIPGYRPRQGMDRARSPLNDAIRVRLQLGPHGMSRQAISGAAEDELSKVLREVVNRNRRLVQPAVADRHSRRHGIPSRSRSPSRPVPASTPTCPMVGWR